MTGDVTRKESVHLGGVRCSSAEVLPAAAGARVEGWRLRSAVGGRSAA